MLIHTTRKQHSCEEHHVRQKIALFMANWLCFSDGTDHSMQKGWFSSTHAERPPRETLPRTAVVDGLTAERIGDTNPHVHRIGCQIHSLRRTKNSPGEHQLGIAHYIVPCIVPKARTLIEKGSVESTPHKVPTSHYHTKHRTDGRCHRGEKRSALRTTRELGRENENTLCTMNTWGG